MQMARGALQLGASALISAFTSDQKANKEVEEARKRWEAMADQLSDFNRAAAGFDVGPLTRELESLRQAHDTLAMAALEARNYTALDQVHETLNKGIRRIFAEWMNGEPVLGELSQKIADLNNEAQGLKETIPDAAAAIDQGLIARIRQVTEEAERGLQADINSATGLDWLNEAGAAIAKFNDLAGKVDPSLLNTWFVVNAQRIIDGSELTGEAFQRLVDQLSQTVPGIAASLHEFTDAIVRTAAEIAKAKQSYVDQLFILQQNQDTLAGQLAVFDLQAQRAREEEIKAGGQALAELEALQAQQRYNIIKDYNDRAVESQQRAAEAQARALEDAQRTFQGFVRNINDFINHYLSGTQGGLSPGDRLANAQSAYASQLALAQSGDRDALNSITQYFTDLVTANRAYNASSAAGAAIEANALAALQALPQQISAEQFIVNAITAASDANVLSLTAVEEAILNSLVAAVESGDADAIALALVPSFKYLTGDKPGGLLTQVQLEDKLNLPNGVLDKVWKELDINGDGMLDKQEVMKKALLGTQTGPLTETETNTDDIGAVATAVQTLADPVQLLALAETSSNTAATANILNDKVNQNLRQISNTLAPGVILYGSGGYTGNGDAARIAGMVHGQEYVLNRSATSAIGVSQLDEINRTGRLPAVAYNDNGPSGSSYRELVAEVRAMRALLRANAEINARGHQRTIDALEGANEISEQAMRKREREPKRASR